MLSSNPITANVLFPAVKSFMQSFVTFIVQEVHKLIFTDNNLIFNVTQIWALEIPA